ncbi:MAG: hypothetical protein PVI26_02785 [Chitinispirillia bacterium]|jgi:hypothetical protein
MVKLSRSLSSFSVFCIVIITINSSDVFSQRNDNRSDIHNTNSGNTGIETTNPSGRSHVYRDSIKVLADLTVHGKVGIGRINTGSCKLAVEGTIGAREVIVTTDTFPDYVFSKDYKLKPLDQVEGYINKNQHLPGIYSADEVKENGISVGKMQVKLLEKIEELTLYMIALEKRNKILEARIDEMEKL